MGESTKIKVSPEQGRSRSVRRFIAPGPRLLQLLDRLQNAEPHPTPLHVAGFQKGIGAHGSMSCRVLTVLFDQELGRVVDVGVG